MVNKVLERAAEDYRRESCNAALKPSIDGPMPEYSGNVKAAFIAGAKWKKTQMMKEAVEANVIATKCGNKYQQLLITDWNGSNDLFNGDKVHIIIVKED